MTWRRSHSRKSRQCSQPSQSDQRFRDRVRKVANRWFQDNSPNIFRDDPEISVPFYVDRNNKIHIGEVLQGELDYVDLADTPTGMKLVGALHTHMGEDIVRTDLHSPEFSDTDIEEGQKIANEQDGPILLLVVGIETDDDGDDAVFMEDRLFVPEHSHR